MSLVTPTIFLPLLLLLLIPTKSCRLEVQGLAHVNEGPYIAKYASVSDDSSCIKTMQVSSRGPIDLPEHPIIHMTPHKAWDGIISHHRRPF